MTDLRNLVRGAVISTMLMHTITGFAADEGSVDEPLSDDDRAAEFICSYTVGETSFGTFQKDFTGYFTRAQAMNPGSGPGVLLKPLKWEKSVNPPPEKGHLLMQMFGKEQVPDELTPYVTGAYLLGHPKPSATARSYDQDPESFVAMAALQFKDGRLSELLAPVCDE